jgi:WD40 repeat protein
MQPRWQRPIVECRKRKRSPHSAPIVARTVGLLLALGRASGASLKRCMQSSPADFDQVCCCDDNKARIFSCSSGDEILVLSGHSARLRSAVFSRFELCALLFYTIFQAYFRDGSKILTSSDDGSARLWSVESGQQIQEFKGHSKKLCSASFSNDGMKVLTCSEVTPVHPRTTRVWSCDSGELLLDADKTTAESTSHHLSQRPWGCESVFSPDGLHVVR